jgi:POT family proton-dependent oligopeptide transporter
MSAAEPPKARWARCPKLMPGPRIVSNIVLNELCERFAFYASRAILVLYLNEELMYSEDFSISLYSYFMAACYFSPLIGGYVADVLLGKFKTIVVFNCSYLTGFAILVTGAFFKSSVGSFIGLFFIALGTGGIKPCISAFGAEQLAGATEADKTSYFFLFYASINAGSTFSYILTPIVREKAGFSSAFALAMGVFFFSFIVFLQGRKQYRKLPPSGSSAYAKIYRVCAAASGHCGRSAHTEASPLISTMESGEAEQHADVEERVATYRCLQNAHGKVPQEDIYGATAVLNVLPVLLMLPVFWAIFDSQGSIWTIQRKHMDNCMFPGVCLTPEQLGALNPILVLVFVALFDKCVFPLFRKLCSARHQPTALRRMTAGMQIAAGAFVLTWMVQVMLDKAPDGTISAWWQLPQFILVSFAEVLVSATGLEWAYSQAPESMRGSVVALYLSMVAIGNVLTGVIFDALAGILSQAQIILLISGFMCSAGCVFAVLAYRYEPLEAPSKRSLQEVSPSDTLTPTENQDQEAT